jgi:hypothetical protein
MNQDNNKNVRKYYPPPPIINSVVQYENVNVDPNLRKLMTEFFLKKSIKWVKNYSQFENCKNILPELESSKGAKIIYNILKEFTKKSDTNWYDLKEKYRIVKDYLRYKLASI